MPKEVGLSLKMEIFRRIYRYSLEKQMKRIDKWSEGLRHFMMELLKWRAPLDLQGFELSLRKAVFALLSAVRVVSKLHDNRKDQLTESEWQLGYFQSIRANEHVRIVLEDRKEFGGEILARALGGMLLLLPITVLIYTPRRNIPSLLIGRILVIVTYSTSQSVGTVY